MFGGRTTQRAWSRAGLRNIGLDELIDCDLVRAHVIVRADLRAALGKEFLASNQLSSLSPKGGRRESVPACGAGWECG